MWKLLKVSNCNKVSLLRILQLAMTSFLAWFEGSQALDRIINMEKQPSNVASPISVPGRTTVKQKRTINETSCLTNRMITLVHF